MNLIFISFEGRYPGGMWSPTVLYIRIKSRTFIVSFDRMHVIISDVFFWKIVNYRNAAQEERNEAYSSYLGLQD